MIMEKEELKKLVLDEYKKGNVVYATIDGLRTCSMEDFVKQPLEGMLYDINRDRVTVTMFLDDIKWVNDYALTHLLEYYYNRCKELEGK